MSETMSEKTWQLVPRGAAQVSMSNKFGSYVRKNVGVVSPTGMSENMRQEDNVTVDVRYVADGPRAGGSENASHI